MAVISDIGGGNNDYPDLISWGNARGSSSDLEIAHVYSDQYFTTDFDHRSDFTGGYEVVGMGNDFVGDFNDTGVIKITRDPSYASWLIDDRTGRGHWKNLIIDCVDGDLLYSAGIKGFKATNAGFKGRKSTAFYSRSALFDGIFNKCAFFTENEDAAYFYSGQVELNDCILVGNASTIYGTLRLRSISGVLTNTVVHEGNGTLCIGADGSTVTGDSNISSDGSATILGLGSQDTNLPTYFEDATTGDLRINSAGQAALPPSLSWAFFDDGGGAVDTITPAPISSGEAFGTASATNLLKVLQPIAVVSEEVVFSAALSEGSVVLSPVAILTEEQFFNVTLQDLTQSVVVQGSVVSEELVPLPSVLRLLQELLPSSIGTQETLGRPLVTGGDRIIIPVSSRETWTAVAKHLGTLKFKGALEDKILAWLRSEGFEGTWNEAWYDYWESLGYTKSFTDKWYKWKKDDSER